MIMKRRVIGRKIFFLIKTIGINMIRMHLHHSISLQLLHHRIKGVQELDLTQGTQPVVPV
jgi:hypothetical protein